MNVMKRISQFAILFLLCAAAGAQESAVPSSSFAETQASATTGRENELYNDGTTYLNEGKWQEAADKFSQVAALKSRRADAALYWKAYALNKAGRRGEAAASIAQLRRQFPNSEWLKEVGALELEMKQASGQSVDPAAESDEDLKLLAINSLLGSDPDRAIPLLQGVLSSPKNSMKLKERALFVLAQSGSPKAEPIIAAVARGQSGPELQVRAIRSLGLEGPRYSQLLQQIYGSATDPDIKKAVLQAYMTSGNKEPVLAAAKSEKDADLRRSAIHQLGAMGARSELEQLYQSSTSADDKEAILQAFGIAGDSEALMKFATSEPDARIRERAIRNLGPFGGPGAGAALVQIYNNEKDADLKRAAVQALFVHGDASSLIALARKETNPEMKRDLVQKLSLMSNKEARDYMLEILNK